MQKLDAAEREALAGLLGKPVRQAASMRLSTTERDAAIARAGLALDLRDALERLDGLIVERKRLHTARAIAFAEAVASARDPRLQDFLAGPRGLGLLKRFSYGDGALAGAFIDRADAVLGWLPADGISRARRLSAQTLGDTHELDDGGNLAALVLGAASPKPTVSRAEHDPDLRSRDRWALLGVAVNELAAPALVLNLPADDRSPIGLLAEQARAFGEPAYLSLRGLLRSPVRWHVADRDVFVCENPDVVAVAADRLGPASAALVCTAGMPSASQRTLLQQLARAGARLRYHGDFDWPGITIGNVVIGRFGAQPWRFCAADYAPESGHGLRGSVVDACWDPALAPRMREHGIAVDEEAVLEPLLADLDRSRGVRPSSAAYL